MLLFNIYFSLEETVSREQNFKATENVIIRAQSAVVNTLRYSCCRKGSERQKLPRPSITCKERIRNYGPTCLATPCQTLPRVWKD